ncbi:Flp family type IVb pilin [Paraburkholderia sp.]|uniref:Flp family type IVb pilin n=1 Tax=Paraburkholderia sp. TaxID=1926495 RepID=UPI0023A69EA1|nr:Flp family type IVb pilin [Paraburkholderia sp.]MDE1184636.1 Flp family type IVb pilin [Paraburkholderia sp.]
MKSFITRFLRENKGVTAIEYGLIAGLIAVAIAGAASTLGTDISNAFTSIGNSITGATGTKTTG